MDVAARSCSALGSFSRSNLQVDAMVETVETNTWAGDKVPAMATKAGAILIEAGAIEIIMISATIIFSAFSS